MTEDRFKALLDAASQGQDITLDPEANRFIQIVAEELKAQDNLLEQHAKRMEADVQLLRMGPSELGFTIEASGRLISIIAGHLATWMREHAAENYTETEILMPLEVSNGGDPYILTIQRKLGKTPHQLRAAAEESERRAHSLLMEALPHIQDDDVRARLSRELGVDEASADKSASA